MALTRAQQWRAVNVAGDHEQDLIDWRKGRITEAEYRATSRIIELPEATEGEPAEKLLLKDANCPF